MTNKHSASTRELQTISHVLSNADRVYSTFNTACVVAPDDMQANLAPVMEVAQAFTKLTDMLSTGNATKDAKLRAGITALLGERKLAYTAEVDRLMREIAPQVPESARLTNYLNLPPEQTITNLNSNYGTASIAAQVSDMQHLAKSYHAKTTPGKLDAALEAIERTAAQQEAQFGVPEGSIRAALKLDQSTFFNSLAKDVSDAPPKPITALLDKKVFTDRLTQRIDADTGVAFHSTVEAVLSRATGRGAGYTKH